VTDIPGWLACELLRAQKYAVRGQCDNTDVWTVPLDGSSGIILSVTEKEGWDWATMVWERVDMQN